VVALARRPRAAKGWPTVFADRRGLLRALASVWEEVQPAGMSGGHLRGLFADGLEEAAVVLNEPGWPPRRLRWREIADLWHALAETAMPDDVPRDRPAPDPHGHGDRSGRRGRCGAAAERKAAAEQLWQLRAAYADAPDLEAERLTAAMAGMSEHLTGIHEAEVAAVARLAGVLLI
jgi:hypothetical protein